MKKYFLIILGLFAFPLLAHAQTTVGSLLRLVGTTLVSLVPIAIGLAVVIFLFGVIKYVNAGDDESGREGARQIMLWGIVFLFVMVSVWGLVSVINATTGVGQGGSGTMPALPAVP